MQLSSFLLIGELGRNLFTTMIFQFLAFICSVFYALIGVFLEIIFSVAQLDNSDLLRGLYEGIQDRFYVIIGVIMLFKVTVSLITYFANPDKITDKELGAGKLVTRFIMVLVLLIFIPQYVFKFLTDIQTPMLSTIGKVILNSSTTLDSKHAHSAGQIIANTIFGGFIQPKDGCGGTAVVTENIFDTAVTLVEEPCNDNKDTYKYSFNFVGALVCVIPILVLLIIIGIQVAIRAFKLMILKIVAPIPIISYMDPKSMKDGGKTSAYINLFMKTYIDLFLNFGVLYFVILLISKMFGSDLTAAGNVLFELAGETKVFGLAFVIIGLFLFAFQAPKFIKKAIGMKDSEFGTGLTGMLVTGAAVTGAVGSGVSGFAASAAGTGAGHLFQNVGAGLSSAIRGGRAGYQAAGDKGDYTRVLGAIRNKNREMAGDRAAGVTFRNRLNESVQSAILGQGPGARAVGQVEGWDQTIKAFKDMKSGIDSEGSKGKYGTVRTNKVTGYDWIYGKSKDFAGQAAVAKSQQLSQFDYNYTDERGVTHNQTIQTKDSDWITGELAKAESSKLYDLLTGNIDPAEAQEIEYDRYRNSAIEGNPNLVAYTDQLDKLFHMNEINSVVGSDMERHLNDIDSQMKVVEKKSIDTKNSTDYIAAQAAAKKNK